LTGFWRCEVPITSPAFASAASCSGRTFEGPQPKRPSDGRRSAGICRSVAVEAVTHLSLAPARPSALRGRGGRRHAGIRPDRPGDTISTGRGRNAASPVRTVRACCVVCGDSGRSTRRGGSRPSRSSRWSARPASAPSPDCCWSRCRPSSGGRSPRSPRRSPSTWRSTGSPPRSPPP
jgi:hypothetical protein